MNHCAGTKKKNHQPVKVYVRQRPFSEHEIALRTPNIIQYLTKTEVVIKSGIHEKRYGFDQVFSEDISQKEVYDTVVAPLIKFMILGYNCTVFAYGQTGTGKTYTIVGGKMGTLEESSAGLIPRAISHLFEELTLISSNIEYTVRVSFIEIYNEEVRDLLNSNNTPLKIFEDPDCKNSVLLKGVKEVTVFNIQEAYSWLNVGLIERQTSSTMLNRHSSRSHSIFTISVITRQLTVDGEELIKTGKLYLVDLAGSENIGRSGSTEIRAREAGNINRSLLTLGKVIKALAQNAQHIPYRDSKLTRILRDSLGGRTKTCMVATISAAASVWDETISTLDYAQVARNVSNCPQVNENRKQAIILKDLKNEIARLRKELAVARAGEGFYMCRDSYETMCEDLTRSQHELAENRKNLTDLIQTKQTLEAENDSIKEMLQKLNTRYDEMKVELEEKKHETKRYEYLVNYLNKREAELKSTTDYLWEICEMSTKHEDLFLSKYEKQCKATLNNAMTAKNSYCVYSDSLQMFHDMTQTYNKSQQTCFDKIRKSTNCLKDINTNIFNHLQECSQKLSLKVTNDIFFLDGNYIYTNIEKSFNGIIPTGFFEKQRDLIENLEQYNSKKIQEVELMTANCMNTLKQVLNDYFLHVTDIKKQESVIKQLKVTVEDNEDQWQNAVNNFKENSAKIVTNAYKDINNKVNCQILESNEVIKKLSQEIDGIRTEYIADFENKINNLLTDFKTVENNHNIYETTVKKAGTQTLKKFRSEIKENIQFVTHVGDTPARRIYKYPKKIEEKLSPTVLYQQLDNSEG